MKKVFYFSTDFGGLLEGLVKGEPREVKGKVRPLIEDILTQFGETLEDHGGWEEIEKQIFLIPCEEIKPGVFRFEGRGGSGFNLIE
jgi:hypothetical protein